jgi:Mannosyl-glycoprotein endo-beta-N-acetylglucosaminidase
MLLTAALIGAPAASAAGRNFPAAPAGAANGILPAAGAASGDLRAAPTATTTVPPSTTVPRTTTTLVPLPTTPGHGPGPNPTGPKSATTSTTTPAPTTSVSPQLVSALVRSVQGDLAQLDAIAGYDQDKGIVTVNEGNVAGADTDADLAGRAETDALARVSADQATLVDRERRLAALAVALYVRSDIGSSPQVDEATATATVNRGVVLGILITHSRDQVARAKVQLQGDRLVLQQAQQRAAGARAAQSAAHLALSKSAVALANAKLAAAGRAPAPISGTPVPTIMGPPALSAGELAGWYASTGYQANTTVPLPILATYYVSTGTTAGLRGDIAFAQSIVETGYFTFPGGGQLLGTDNNFAGIGACDTCAHGWRFPDAKTGVAAQVQLLAAYASAKKIPTPLVGRVDVAGCCQTWLALSGVWATATDYGYIILNVYKEMLDWAIPQRLGAAGL